MIAYSFPMQPGINSRDKKFWLDTGAGKVAAIHESPTWDGEWFPEWKLDFWWNIDDVSEKLPPSVVYFGEFESLPAFLEYLNR